MLLVSILGDFHSSIFPIFYEFKERLTTHLIVHDRAFKERRSSKKIIDSLNNFSASNALSIQTLEYSVDEDSFESILELIESIKSLESNLEEIYINTTDGLSNIGVILGSKLLSDGVNVLSYDMYENSYNITANNSIVTKKLNSKMSIKDHFELKGFTVHSVEDKSFAHKYAKQIKNLFEEYYDEFVLLKKDITHSRVGSNKKYINALRIIRELKLNTDTQRKEITGGLFEWYVYLVVKDLGFDDIEVGAIVLDHFSSTSTIKNEFDILIMKDNHLNMIECKFTKRVDIQALVYKYSTLINLIDDDGKMMILTDQETYSYDLYQNAEPKLIPYRRALVNRILIRGSILGRKEEFIEDINSYLKTV